MPSFHLLPAPKQFRLSPGKWVLPPDVYIVLQSHAAARDVFGAERFVIEAEPLTGSDFHIVVGEPVDPAREIHVAYDESIASEAPPPTRDQAYVLKIARDGIRISVRSAAGAFYAFQTLLQIVRECAGRSPQRRANRPRAASSKARASTFALPCLSITDFPDFARRGVYHDTARGKVPTVDTLLQLIDDLGHLKYNEFQLYVENAFEFRRHPPMFDDTTPLTAEELLMLDAACRARHIDFVPSLTSLGHFEKILSRPAFRHLAEAEPAQLKAIGATCWYEAAPWSLCVTDPEARAFLKAMYDDFLPNFTSPHFNICCDEAYDLGTVRSKAAAEKLGGGKSEGGAGTGQLYVEWINYCNNLAQSHGKSIQMWGDIILNHPELIEKLPDHTTLIEWGYEHNHKFEEHCQIFAERLKIDPRSAMGQRQSTFYASPGTSSWLTLGGRSKNAFGNIHSAATAGLKYGASGLLVTDWGDNGHQQMLAVSLAAFAYGAAAGWNLAATPNLYAPKKPLSAFSIQHSEFLKSASLHWFEDPAGEFASLAYDLGLMYERFGWERFNASVDWYLFREKWDFANYVNRVTPGNLDRVIRACEALETRLRKATLNHPHGEQIRMELMFTCDEIVHTCRRTALRQQWLAVDPARRNPEEPDLRGKKPRARPPAYAREMAALRADARQLEKRFRTLWLARNKPSRLEDVTAEFRRLEKEYAQFAR